MVAFQMALAGSTPPLKMWNLLRQPCRFPEWWRDQAVKWCLGFVLWDIWSRCRHFSVDTYPEDINYIYSSFQELDGIEGCVLKSTQNIQRDDSYTMIWYTEIECVAFWKIFRWYQMIVILLDVYGCLGRSKILMEFAPLNRKDLQNRFCWWELQ